MFIYYKGSFEEREEKENGTIKQERAREVTWESKIYIKILEGKCKF